ncbi:MAG: formylglycine-generating enzyme family protein [Verrucomicrobia bacterium]|nr:formylglycine-generating enzyme family protein [Verrucomicrobiota bacterium]
MRLAGFLFALILGVSLGLVPEAAELSAQLPSPTLKIEIAEGTKVRVTFSRKLNERYQVYVTHDLKNWHFFGSIVQGGSQPITIEYPGGANRTAFFRVESRPTFAPVHSRMERGTNGEIHLSFPTVAGRRYQAALSIDLERWDFSDLIDGTGSRESTEIDFPVPAAFFRVEAVDILPLPNMVWIPQGRFVMGSPPDEKDRDLDEDPLTQVVFPSGFWMGKYEVTQGEYERITGTNPSGFNGDPSRPVERVSWEDAVAYCARLTQTEFSAGRLPFGYAYRLPTEAEFEYACRAGTTTRYSFGDDLDYTELGEYAWYDANSLKTTHPVGQKRPNLFGLHDIYGNVWEWCHDYYDSAYPGGSIERPSGPSSGVSRVFRGGGWDWKASSCRSAYRNNVLPTRRSNYLGFRVVLGPVLY